MAGFDESFDWVVVGCGAGSMSSGLLMRQAGKSVVILEKSPFAGGTTAKSGGMMWIPNNPFMDPGEDSTEKGITYLDAVVGDDPAAPGSTHEKRLAYVVEGPKMIDFLVKQGVQLERGSHFWPDYYDEMPGGCKTSRTVTAKPFNKKELGDWAPKLRRGMLEMPVRLDDAQKVPYARDSWAIKFLVLKTGLKIIAGKLTGKHWVTAGAAVQGRMLQQALKRDIDIRLDSPVAELIVDNGKVTGVVTVKDGKPWRIGANLGVLVNAGGFAKNQEMRDKYMPGTHAEWSRANECDTGDMHREMERLGGVLAQMDQMVGTQTSLLPDWETTDITAGMQGVTAKPHAILIDQSGVRYMNEGGSYEEYCENMLVRNRTIGAVPSWAVFDQQYWNRYKLGNGGAGKKIPQRWIDTGYLRQANSVEELAKLLKIDPATLRATIDRWNSMVDKGHDEDFHRGERDYDKFLGDPFRDGAFRTIGRIDRAPYYAVEVVPGDVSTYGGIVTDSHSRVLRGDGAPIEGLYATGVSTASPMGRVYPGAGASVGPSMVFGWIAAKHAAGLDNATL